MRPITYKMLESGSVKDYDPGNVELYHRVECDTSSWDSIAVALNKACDFGMDENTEAYTAETIQSEYPNYLRLFRDGVVLLYL